MKILKLNNGKVKFESKKENEVLIDVFLKKSVEDLKKLGIDYDFDEIRKNENWRKYIECKLKVVMGIDEKNCFHGEEETFYKENILDKFFKEEGFDQFYENNNSSEEILNNLFLREYFENKNINENNVKQLDFKQNKIDLKGLGFLKIVNGFIFMIGENSVKGYYNLYTYRYRLPLKMINPDIIHLIDKNDIFYVKLAEYRGKDDIGFLEDVSNFLLTRIDLTQDIQEIKI